MTNSERHVSSLELKWKKSIYYFPFGVFLRFILVRLVLSKNVNRLREQTALFAYFSFFYLEMKFCHVVQPGFELLGSHDLALSSQAVVTASTCHHNQL